MRHATPDDETDQLHPVATDQPGLILHRPLRKLRQVAIVYALLPLLCAAVGAWIATQVAYGRAERHTDARIATLEQDLAQRRAANQQSNAERDRQIAELRRLVCILADHAQPRDDQVEQVRATYGCTGGPYPEPSAAPPAPSETQPPAPGTTRTTAAAAQQPHVPPATQPAPRPTTTRPPATTSSPPAPGSPLLCVDLRPLLPKICV